MKRPSRWRFARWPTPWPAVPRWGEQLRAQQAQADAEGARFNWSDLRYRNGVASYLDLLDAQRAVFTARQAVVQTRLAQLQNQVALYKALGGGWKDPAPR
jgi:multidrug efflux system outer membrane protein